MHTTSCLIIKRHFYVYNKCNIEKLRETEALIYTNNMSIYVNFRRCTKLLVNNCEQSTCHADVHPINMQPHDVLRVIY